MRHRNADHVLNADRHEVKKAEATENARLEAFRTRWMRWLGNKTRVDKFTWTDLLATDWQTWAKNTLRKHNVVIPRFDWKNHSNPLMIREYYAKAIQAADMSDLQKLDGKYCSQKFSSRARR